MISSLTTLLTFLEERNKKPSKAWELGTNTIPSYFLILPWKFPLILIPPHLFTHNILLVYTLRCRTPNLPSLNVVYRSLHFLPRSSSPSNTNPYMLPSKRFCVQFIYFNHINLDFCLQLVSRAIMIGS